MNCSRKHVIQGLQLQAMSGLTLSRSVFYVKN